MASQAARGKKALDAKDFDKAIVEYSSAIKESPTSPEFFIQRSIAYQRLQKYEEALADAEQGVLNGQKRAKKEAIIDGQFRRGMALHCLGRYADADFLFQKIKKMKSDHKEVGMWLAKNDRQLTGLEGGDERRLVTVSETPTLKENTNPANGTSSPPPAMPSQAPVVPKTSPSALAQTPADKIRYEWYQNTENIYFTLLAKAVPKDKIEVDITERAMSIAFPLQSGSSYGLTLDPLFAPVTPEKCITRVMPTKVEIILIKKTAGQKWSALESNEPVERSKTDSVHASADGDAVKRAVFSEVKQSAPAYPTSSKSGPKDWDKLDMGGDEDDDGGDPANAFFKKLFKGADPDTQRAMMKSYTESNGTALSTNWEEVGKGPVPTEPPSGMEAKKWEQ